VLYGGDLAGHAVAGLFAGFFGQGVDEEVVRGVVDEVGVCEEG
jgi:hypothetical protein